MKSTSISSSLKKSFLLSLYHKTNNYLTFYKIKKSILNNPDDLENLIDSIFIFWILESSKKNNLWTENVLNATYIQNERTFFCEKIKQNIVRYLS